MNTPGLVSREIVSETKDTVTLREVWDPRVKGCPLLVFTPYTWPLQILNHSVESVTHTIEMPRRVYDAKFRDAAKG